MDKTSLILYTQYAEIFNRLSDEEAGMLIKSIFTYQQTGIKEDLPGAWGMGYFMIVQQLEKDNERWENTCKLRSEAGRKGGLVSKSKQKQAKLSKAKQSQANQADNEYEYDNDNENEDQKINTPLIPPKGKPTPEIDFGKLDKISPELRQATDEWLAYKKEKRESYKPVGLNALITKIANAAGKHGTESTIEVIQQSMASGYKGIMFDRLDKSFPAAKPKYIPKNYDDGEDFLSGGDFD